MDSVPPHWSEDWCEVSSWVWQCRFATVEGTVLPALFGKEDEYSIHANCAEHELQINDVRTDDLVVTMEQHIS